MTKQKYIDGVKSFDGIVYIDDWLILFGYLPRDMMERDFLSKGKTHGEFWKDWEILEDKFQSWCEHNEVIAG
jgi:hypothetical protein